MAVLENHHVLTNWYIECPLDSTITLSQHSCRAFASSSSHYLTFTISLSLSLSHCLSLTISLSLSLSHYLTFTDSLSLSLSHCLSLAISLSLSLSRYLSFTISLQLHNPHLMVRRVGLGICPSTSHIHSHTFTLTHSLSPVLGVMMKSIELKTKIYSHAHSLILSHWLSHCLKTSRSNLCRFSDSLSLYLSHRVSPSHGASLTVSLSLWSDSEESARAFVRLGKPNPNITCNTAANSRWKLGGAGAVQPPPSLSRHCRKHVLTLTHTSSHFVLVVFVVDVRSKEFKTFNYSLALSFLWDVSHARQNQNQRVTVGFSVREWALLARNTAKHKHSERTRERGETVRQWAKHRTCETVSEAQWVTESKRSVLNAAQWLTWEERGWLTVTVREWAVHQRSYHLLSVSGRSPTPPTRASKRPCCCQSTAAGQQELWRGRCISCT